MKTAEEILAEEMKSIYPDYDDDFLCKDEKQVLVKAIKRYAKAKLEEAAELITRDDGATHHEELIESIKQSITETPLD